MGSSVLIWAAMLSLQGSLAWAAPAGVPVASKSAHAMPETLESVRKEINLIERDLLESRESQLSATAQLKKIRRLLALQQTEVLLSRKKITELSTSMDALSEQKRILLEKILAEKINLRQKLRELDRMTKTEALDARWLGDLDKDAQRAYFLSKTLKKELASVDRLRQDVLQAQSLELRILEEKSKLDYYVQELNAQMAQLSANEEVQKEIIRTNRSSRLEALSRVRSLKESEQELERMLSNLRQSRQAPAVASRPGDRSAPIGAERQPLARGEPDGLSAISKPELSLAALKGKLPLPVEGPIVSGFGKSYNPKTNLLTFQKGISVGGAAGREVRSVATGKVVFAGPLKNYGLITIVEHPGQYYTLYGQMGSVAMAEGAMVVTGDVVGKTNGEPLYFEIRNKNVAINPLQWLAAGIFLGKQ